MKTSVFISCPLSICESELEKIKKSFLSKFSNVELISWDRYSRYDTQDLKSADVYLQITPNNKFNFKFSELPVGCYLELTRANSLKKPLVLCYRTNDGEYNFYSVRVNNYDNYDFINGEKRIIDSRNFDKFSSGKEYSEKLEVIKRSHLLDQQIAFIYRNSLKK